MNNPRSADVSESYMSGLDAVDAISGGFDPADWQLPACGRWDAADTARHLLGVADWYHAWLDRAVDGDAAAPFDPSEFDVRNTADVAAHRDLSGPEATRRFLERARSYLERATPHWDLPFGFPLGTITVGLHLGVAAAEWHIRAWDLTASRPPRHVPENADKLFVAAGAAIAAATGGLKGRFLTLAVPLAARRRPWPTMLERSGRTPNRAV